MSIAEIDSDSSPRTDGQKPRSSSTGRILTILARDAKLSPRSPVVIMAIVMPLVITFVVRLIFGGILEAPPSLAVTGADGSQVSVELLETDAVAATWYPDGAQAREAVRLGDVNATLVLPADLDSTLRSGGTVEVEYLVNGETLAVDRDVLTAVVTDAMRSVAGQEPAVSVSVEVIGGEDYIPLAERMLPVLVVYSIVIAALFVPAASLLDERVRGTLDAILVTPASLKDVLVAKGVFAGGMSMALGWVTLLINDAFAGQFLGLSLALLVGTVMLVLLGLILGLWASDMNTLYSWIKAGGILIILPALVFMFPAVPLWIGQLTPTYFFLAPIFELSVAGGALGDSLLDLGIGIAVCLVLIPVLWWSMRRNLQRRARG